MTRPVPVSAEFINSTLKSDPVMCKEKLARRQAITVEIKNCHLLGNIDLNKNELDINFPYEITTADIEPEVLQAQLNKIVIDIGTLSPSAVIALVILINAFKEANVALATVHARISEVLMERAEAVSKDMINQGIAGLVSGVAATAVSVVTTAKALQTEIKAPANAELAVQRNPQQVAGQIAPQQNLGEVPAPNGQLAAQNVQPNPVAVEPAVPAAPVVQDPVAVAQPAAQAAPVNPAPGAAANDAAGIQPDPKHIQSQAWLQMGNAATGVFQGVGGMAKSSYEGKAKIDQAQQELEKNLAQLVQQAIQGTASSSKDLIDKIFSVVMTINRLLLEVSGKS